MIPQEYIINFLNKNKLKQIKSTFIAKYFYYYILYQGENKNYKVKLNNISDYLIKINKNPQLIFAS